MIGIQHTFAIFSVRSVRVVCVYCAFRLLAVLVILVVILVLCGTGLCATVFLSVGGRIEAHFFVVRRLNVARVLFFTVMHCKHGTRPF